MKPGFLESFLTQGDQVQDSPKYRNFLKRELLAACPNCTSFCGDHGCRLHQTPLSLPLGDDFASLLVHQSDRQHGHTNLTSTLRTPVDTGCGFQGQSSPLGEDGGQCAVWVHTIISLKIVGQGHPEPRGTMPLQAYPVLWPGSSARKPAASI